MAFVVFHLEWGKSEKTFQFVHLQKGVRKKGPNFHSQYGTKTDTMLDEFGRRVYEYCDVFYAKFTDKKTSQVRKICWPLGDDTECKRRGVKRWRQKRNCKRYISKNVR